MVKNIQIIIICPYQVKDWGPTNRPQMTTDHHGRPQMTTDAHRWPRRPPPRM